MADDILSLLGGMKRPTATETFGQNLLGYQRPSMSMEPMAQNMLGYQPSSIELNPMARTIQPSMMDRVSSGLGGIGSSFSGPGSNARFQALAASLLTGPSRTPISFGSQLAKGLLAGTQAAQAEQDSLFKRGLLEKEISLAERRLAREEAKTNLLDSDIYNVVGKDGNVIRQVIGGTQAYLDAVNDPDTTLSKIGTYPGKSTDLKGYDVYQLQEDGSTKIIGTFSGTGAEQYFGLPGYRVTEMGAGLKGGISDALSEVDLSKDTKINPDGSVEILPNSKTAIDLELKQDQLTLSRAEFDEKVRQFNEKQSIAEAEEQRAQTKFDLEIESQKALKLRQEDAGYENLSKIVNTISAIESTLASDEDSIISAVGPGSILSEISVFGPSTQAGVLKNQVDELISFLTFENLKNLKDQSKTGATGFGALNTEELKTIQRLEGSLNRATTIEEFKRVLKEIKTRFGAHLYGVVMPDNQVETYSPSRHYQGILTGELKINSPIQQTTSAKPVRRYNPDTGGFENIGSN